MKTAVIVFPGSNCDRDIAVALEACMGTPPLMLWHRETEIPANLDLIAIPGGFSYGDYLRSGAMAAHSPVMRNVQALAAKGVRVLGICNGFQILTEAGLLPGVLMRNQRLKFICRDVHLRVENSESDFTRSCAKGQVLRIPIAHHDGNFFADQETLDRIEGDGQVAFRYCTPDGVATNAPDININGSQHNIAGVFNKAKTILGMMPHPERAIAPVLGGTDGKIIFESLVEALG